MEAAKALKFGRFELQARQRRLLRDGEPVAVGSRAFDVLLALVERRERVVSKAELLDLVWRGLVVEENNLEVQVSSLRRLLGSQAIATIPGRGYRFTAELAGSDEASPPTKHRLAAIMQPFGGEGLSGTGPKAGGPNYLPRFAVERTLSVNTAAAGGNAALLAEGEV